MPESWMGHITIDGSPGIVEDVQLWSIDENRRPVVPPSNALRFISNVYLSSVPLHLAVGPSSELYTGNADTAAWLHERLLPDCSREQACVNLRHGYQKQLDVGVLLGVEGPGTNNEVTELLLYVELQGQEGPSPTPLCPSPGLQSGEPSAESPPLPSSLLKVYALPLCSEIIAGGIIALNRAVVKSPSSTSSVKRRKSVIDRFDDATLYRQNWKGRGGDRILRVLSNTDKTTREHGSEVTSGGEGEINSIGRTPKSFSRAPSVTVDSHSRETSVISQGASAPWKRSSLNHVDSAILPHELSVKCNDQSNYAEQNKAALTKVVLAGMRLYGLQQRKKRANQPKQVSILRQDSTTTASDCLNDETDEYKLVYNQTFKAAVFALRSHFSVQLLRQETMRGVVDRLLDLFCSNTLSMNDDGAGSLEAPGTASQENMNAFDLPSSSILLDSRPKKRR